MRLIDADDFFARMENDTDLCAEMETDGLKALKKYLDMQPTTYHVNKVVKELESFAKLAENRYKNNTSPHSLQEHRCWVKSIEIVEHGGVSDGVCECRLFKGYKFLHKTSCGNVFDMQNCFKYCPYCGKKIKAVE